MRSSAILVPASFCLAALFCGCGSNPGGIGDITDQDYFPFTAGDSWMYERYGQVDTLGVSYSFTGSEVVSVFGFEPGPPHDLIQLFTAGTDTLFAEGLDTLFIPVGGTSFAGMDDGGVWLYTDSLMTDSVIVAQFPLTVGDSWPYSTDPEATAEVVAMDEVVTVPDGTFDDVLHIRVTQGDPIQITQDSYFAPGIGNIMNNMEISADTLTLYSMTEQLTHHSIF